MFSSEQPKERAYVVHPHLSFPKTVQSRDAESLIAEACGLALAIDLDIVQTKILNVKSIQPGAYLGKGQRGELAAEIETLEPDILIFNGTLSPVQQRNLERELQVKVIDRTGLILEIFGARAQTKEGRLQVELAALEYQRSRLVRSWTHLERQRGGAGFMGGPGETQIEIDRRLISDRLVKIRKDIQDVRRTRGLARKSRERVPFPVVSLVGYTNAGKSSLFNVLSDANVMAEDLLFATLDPTMRRLDLPNGQRVILADTVGFISDLPTQLIAAFRATLEQVSHADVIVHVIDVSQDDYMQQRADVIKILEELGVKYDEDERIIEAWNKIDVLDEEARIDVRRAAGRLSAHALLISATGQMNLDALVEKIMDVSAGDRVIVRYALDLSDGKALAWLYDHAQVLSRVDGPDACALDVRIDPAQRGRFEEQYNFKVLT